MRSTPPRREDLLEHCGQLRDDDGIDPREFFRANNSRTQAHRKTLQLCSQVAEALQQILGSEFDDDVLLGLAVLVVEPGGNASQLHVTLRYDGPEIPQEEVLRRLAAVSGCLRAGVTAAITRKHAPQLYFRLA